MCLLCALWSCSPDLLKWEAFEAQCVPLLVCASKRKQGACAVLRIFSQCADCTCHCISWLTDHIDCHGKVINILTHVQFLAKNLFFFSHTHKPCLCPLVMPKTEVRVCQRWSQCEDVIGLFRMKQIHVGRD